MRIVILALSDCCRPPRPARPRPASQKAELLSLFTASGASARELWTPRRRVQQT